MCGEEDLELRMIRLRRLHRLMTHRQRTEERKEPEKKSPIDELRRYLTDRGDEVLDAAKSIDPVIAERVASSLLLAISDGRVTTPISGGELLTLFKRVGLPIKIDTRLLVQRRGEVRELRDALGERWRSLEERNTQ